MAKVKYNTETRVKEVDLGYESVRLCRAKFIWFEFTGLRENTEHWIFFGGKDVTSWVQTGVDEDTFRSSDRKSVYLDPGDRYITETAYPSALGGPTAASGPLVSDAAGKIYGIFFLQSNTDLSFETGVRHLRAIDIQSPNLDNSLSHADGTYEAIGKYELVADYEYTVQVPIATPPTLPINVGDGDGGGPDCGCDPGYGGDPCSGGGGGGAGGGGGDGCFIRGTQVTMADFTTKSIEDVQIGEYVIGVTGVANKVTFVEKPSTKRSPLLKNIYAPDGQQPFATMNHPMWVDGQLSAVNPSLVNFFYPWLANVSPVAKLENYILGQTDDDFVYNLWVEGDGTYMVNGYATHSILYDGGFLKNAFVEGLMTSDQISYMIHQHLKLFGTDDNSKYSSPAYGGYIFNKYVGKWNNKYFNKALAAFINTRVLSDGNRGSKWLLKNFLRGIGYTQLVVEGKKSPFNAAAILKQFKSKV